MVWPSFVSCGITQQAVKCQFQHWDRYSCFRRMRCLSWSTKSSLLCFQVRVSTPEFSPALGGLGRPIGRPNGFGVNSKTALPSFLGASARGSSGGVGIGVTGAAFSASRRYNVLKDRHWQSEKAVASSFETEFGVVRRETIIVFARGC